MKLFNSIGPNPKVVRMFMAELGIEIEKEEIDLMGGANRQEPYVLVNPGGQLPALELDSGAVISEITGICEYLSERQGGVFSDWSKPRGESFDSDVGQEN